LGKSSSSKRWPDARLEPRIEVVARARDRSGLSVNVYIERVDLRSVTLVDQGKTQVRYGGWWRSRQLEPRTTYRVIVDFKAYGKWYGDSREVRLNNKDETVYFGPIWDYVQPYSSKSKLGSFRSKAKSDGTKMYRISQMEEELDMISSSGEIKCSYCGVTSSITAKYCENCGKKLKFI